MFVEDEEHRSQELKDAITTRLKASDGGCILATLEIRRQEGQHPLTGQRAAKVS